MYTRNPVAMSKTMDLDSLRNQLEFHFAYAMDLVVDIEPADFCHTPAKGLENHPCFTIGHIITAYGLTTRSLGGAYTVKDEWDELFRRNGPGDPRYPVNETERYPGKQELLDELKAQHQLLLEQLETVSVERLNKKVEWRFTTYFPQLRDMLYFMCVSHYAMHISQLACWRRAMNLPSSLARL